MRHKSLQIMLVVLILMATHLTVTGVVYADSTGIEELEPNEYEKKKVKTNKSLLHDESASTTVRSQIPEHIKELTFDKKVTSKTDEMATLFLNETINRNTIQSKAVEMELFAAATSATNSQLEEDSTSSSNLSMSVLIWVLVGICSISLAAVLYVWGTSSAKKQVS